MSLDPARNQPSPARQIAPDEQTRQRLLRAAVHVFDRKGYTAASVREIVERAGVTKPALYYHFQSKEGLLSAVLAEGWRQFDAALELTAAGPGTTRARLAALGDAMNALLEQNVPFVRVAHAVFFGPGRIAPGFDLTAFDRSLERAIGRIVADGIAAGEIVPAEPRDVAIAFAGVVGACAARQLHPPYEAVGVARFRRILGLLFDGILSGQRDGILSGQNDGILSGQNEAGDREQ